ncbi:hypothetical protein VAPA_1c24300 [Variovorax paradoxus B4]|uniref:Uncharacterized protein n=1 Tax=Variovorax paradoxus B4 TaxID=1246301 RepID=T1X9B8_VARPD|nr:hypothetical protein [Variovorax paradoxus]AGU49532.1 hypothetical protein VAPA_1c24300 [Variovorax paradoxus B4]
MAHTLFKQILTTRLPTRFYSPSEIDQLKDLRDAGYIKVAFSPQQGAMPPFATVHEITNLGRAAARYFGSTYAPLPELPSVAFVLPSQHNPAG